MIRDSGRPEARMKGIFEDAQRQWAVEILKPSQRSCLLWNPKSSRVRLDKILSAGCCWGVERKAGTPSGRLERRQRELWSGGGLSYLPCCRDEMPNKNSFRKSLFGLAIQGYSFTIA